MRASKTKHNAGFPLKACGNDKKEELSCPAGGVEQTHALRATKSSFQPSGIQIKRNNDKHMNKTIFLSALLIIVLIAFNSCKKEKSECLTCPPSSSDTTSHVIQWQAPDTLGTQGIIRDVWVFDRNNAWAVGEIYLNDSTGKPDMENPYNVAKWNGTQWQLSTSIEIGYLYGQLYCIYAFSLNDIWGGGTIPVHWDGAKWTFYGSTRGYPGGFYINKIYGTSSSNLFIVGTGGNIVHFNGTSWTKMTSNTTVDLQDIWGIDGSHIWATGFNSIDGHSVVLQFNGIAWSTIYDNANKPANQIQYFNTGWTDNVNYLFLDGGSYTNILNLHDGSFKRTDSLSSNEVFCIRGINRNDIFRVGYGGETAHYNGVSWYLYPELKALNDGTAWFQTIYPSENMVVIGGWFPTALNGFPVVVRGYR